MLQCGFVRANFSFAIDVALSRVHCCPACGCPGRGGPIHRSTLCPPPRSRARVPDPRVSSSPVRLPASGSEVERVRGIEPPSSAWKAVALPLSYTRVLLRFRSGGGGSRTRTYEGLASGFTVRPLCRSGHSPSAQPEAGALRPNETPCHRGRDSGRFMVTARFGVNWKACVDPHRTGTPRRGSERPLALPLPDGIPVRLSKLSASIASYAMRAPLQRDPP
jgi:hypothetical protein